jgi:hypothetical protein
VKRRARALSTAAVAALALLGTAACGPAVASQPAAAATDSASSAPTAADVLAGLPVKGRAPMTGYDRDRFGPAWTDVDRNGCGTRDDVLARDLPDEVLKAGTGDCVVLSGTLADPYTATTIAFVKGDGTSVDVDHVVALGNAWATGAFGWDDARRTALANDPLNLLAVDFSANRQKGDGDAATWLPANRGFRCDYVARQVAVKSAYGLWVTAAERDAMGRVLTGCPDQRLPAAEPLPAAEEASVAGGAFPDCAAARAAGAAPVRSGDPGYSRRIDGDGDGIGCE